MVGELAQMAEAIGEAEWAEALREAVRSDALQPQTSVTLRRS